MLSQLSSVTWNETLNETLNEFFLHKQAAYAAKTIRYYRIQLTELIRWSDSEGIAFEEFGKRHMDRYTAFRISQGKPPRLQQKHSFNRLPVKTGKPDYFPAARAARPPTNGIDRIYLEAQK